MIDKEIELHNLMEIIIERLKSLRDSKINYIYKTSESIMSDKKTLLKILKEEKSDGCTKCKLCKTRTNIVFGSGLETAKIMFIGEAPGRDEDLQGLPFVGRAGQLLEKMIEAMGLSREKVYITNVLKCRPEDNRNPEEDEIEACKPVLFEQIDIIKPKVIVGLGKYACQTLLKTEIIMSKLRGNWHELNGIKFMPTFHPAYLLRNPASKKEVWEDLQKVMAIL